MLNLVPVDHDPFGEMRELQLVRHGATRLNNDDVSVDRIRGWKDIPLSPDGRAEATKLGEKLKSEPPTVIVASDLDRAAETARIIAKAIGLPVSEYSQAFRPWNVGKYAGELTKKAIPILADYAMNRPTEKLPDGESFDDFRARFFTGLVSVFEKYQGKIAVVTHHRDERLLKAWLKEGNPVNGDIDKAEFNQKGEPTGSVETLHVPIEPLQLAALSSYLMQSAVPVEHDPFQGMQ